MDDNQSWGYRVLPAIYSVYGYRNQLNNMNSIKKYANPLTNYAYL